MKNKSKIARSICYGIPLAFCVSAFAQDHAPAANWNDTSIGFRYSDDFYFPGSDQKVAQKIGFLNSSGGFKYGSYMFNVDFLVSDMNNPEANGSQGAQEVYSVGHVNWSASKIFGTSMKYGVIRDVGLSTGYELSSKNDAFGSRARMLAIGPEVDFAVPKGYWSAMVGWRSETNHNGISHADIHYDTAAHGETAWMIPFNAGPAPMVFKGFISATAPKGLDGFHVQTKTEVLSRMSILFDVGALAGHPRTFYLGPGYEYWNNMFGTPRFETPGTHRSAATIVGEIHF